MPLWCSLPGGIVGARFTLKAQAVGIVDLSLRERLLVAVPPGIRSARALAVTTKTRSPSFPNLPTIAEQGLPDFETYTWNAVFGPAGMPAATVQRLSAEFRKAVADPDIQQRLRDLSGDPVGSTPDELSAQIKAEIVRWAPIIQAAGLKSE